MLWKFQVETAIKGYGLEEYVLGTIVKPPQTINENGKVVQNQDYQAFQRQDSIISSWLLSTISATLLPQLIGCKSSYEIWATIEQNFSRQCTARVMYHKRKLQNIKKEELPMREYLSRIKMLCDQLSSTGHTISDLDQILYILSGLDEEYESVIAVITSRETAPIV